MGNDHRLLEFFISPKKSHVAKKIIDRYVPYSTSDWLESRAGSKGGRLHVTSSEIIKGCVLVFLVFLVDQQFLLELVGWLVGGWVRCRVDEMDAVLDNNPMGRQNDSSELSPSRLY
jgi:hypothetical protein